MGWKAAQPGPSLTGLPRAPPPSAPAPPRALPRAQRLARQPDDAAPAAPGEHEGAAEPGNAAPGDPFSFPLAADPSASAALEQPRSRYFLLSIGSYSFLSGPVYTALGLKILLSFRYSSTLAVQPETLLTAKIGVNMAVSMPRARYTIPE